MDSVTIMAFVDELAKVASNMAAPNSKKTGLGQNSVVSLKSGAGFKSPSISNPMKSAGPPKPTNYSIVNSEAPMAAQGTASATSKAVPPPPVRT